MKHRQDYNANSLIVAQSISHLKYGVSSCSAFTPPPIQLPDKQEVPPSFLHYRKQGRALLPYHSADCKNGSTVRAIGGISFVILPNFKTLKI